MANGPLTSAQLETFQPYGLAINQIILAEIASIFDNEAQLEELLPRNWLNRLDLPWDAAFVTSRAFLQYRRSGGPREVPMPDFYIGAHALVAGIPLITRDATRYRTYFPGIQLVAPN